jgi:hypothetical protein
LNGYIKGSDVLVQNIENRYSASRESKIWSTTVSAGIKFVGKGNIPLHAHQVGRIWKHVKTLR